MSLCELAKCRRVVTAVLAVAACAGLAGAAHAHPHVWATVRSEIILNADHQITGVRHSWTFDEFYSAMAVQGLDTNGDGVFSAKELEPLAEVNIKSLKDFDYFTFVHIGNADNLPLKPPENYSLDYDKSLLTLHFTLPVEKPIDTHGQEVQVDVYDPSFFVAFGFATEAPVKLSGSAIKGCTAEVNVKSLKDFDYFTFVHIGDGDNLPLKPPENYSLGYDKGLLTLHFTLPLAKPVDTHKQAVDVDVYDPSFF
ncbi:MAG: DUF1007 family protein, partial [Methyloceanibacter sp.]